MRLPLFPLHTVLFPGQRLPLHVFEPRYRTMMGDVLDAERRFGVVAIKAGTEVGPPSEVHETGTVAEITQLAQLDDGRYALICAGLQRFTVERRLPDDPYPIADVRMLDDDALGADAAGALERARTAVSRYLDELRSLGADVPMPPREGPAAESFALPAIAPFDLPLRQSILEQPTASERLALTAEIALREAKLLATVGPSAGVPLTRPSQN